MQNDKIIQGKVQNDRHVHRKVLFDGNEPVYLTFRELLHACRYQSDRDKIDR
jgi:hypothetical protein